MYKLSVTHPKNIKILGIICGSLVISALAYTQTAQAQQRTSKINPCPRIFYEEPHNNQVLVPNGDITLPYIKRLSPTTTKAQYFPPFLQREGG